MFLSFLCFSDLFIYLLQFAKSMWNVLTMHFTSIMWQMQVKHLWNVENVVMNEDVVRIFQRMSSTKVLSLSIQVQKCVFVLICWRRRFEVHYVVVSRSGQSWERWPLAVSVSLPGSINLLKSKPSGHLYHSGHVCVSRMKPNPPPWNARLYLVHPYVNTFAKKMQSFHAMKFCWRAISQKSISMLASISSH